MHSQGMHGQAFGHWDSIPHRNRLSDRQCLIDGSRLLRVPYGAREKPRNRKGTLGHWREHNDPASHRRQERTHRAQRADCEQGPRGRDQPGRPGICDPKRNYRDHKERDASRLDGYLAVGTILLTVQPCPTGSDFPLLYGGAPSQSTSAGNYLSVALTLWTMLKSKTCSGSTGCLGLMRTAASAIIWR